ncbi:MAG: ATP-binding protein [Clostridia bacterium]|nr:ATP-binding protein [Clostridia bacterium]
MYNAYVGYSEYDPEIVREFQGYSAEVAHEFWRRSLAAYLGTDDENVINSVEEKVRCVSYAKLLSWSERHSDPGNTKDVKTRALWRARLIELLGHVDSLLFDVECGEAADPSVLKVEAAVENLEKVLDFINAKLDAAGCSERAKMQIDLAAEEIFVNIASYAYAPGKGDATVRFELAENNSEATLSFTDGGRPFNPLAAAEPDVTLPVEEREVGGLGIFLTGKLMDDVFYEYRGGKNILTMKKKL